jgi:hypothetical protein
MYITGHFCDISMHTYRSSVLYSSLILENWNLQLLTIPFPMMNPSLQKNTRLSYMGTYVFWFTATTKRNGGSNLRRATQQIGFEQIFLKPRVFSSWVQIADLAANLWNMSQHWRNFHALAILFVLATFIRTQQCINMHLSVHLSLLATQPAWQPSYVG